MRQRLAETRIFWREFRHTFTSTGAVLPSGPALAKSLARHVKQSDPGKRNTPTRVNRAATGSPRQQIGHTTFTSTQSVDPNPPKPARRILEVGSGTGPVTAQIIRQLGPRDTLDLVELNTRFVSVLQDRLHRDPRWQPVADRVRIHPFPIEELPTDQPFEVIISGLPLNNFSCEAVRTILNRFHQLAAANAMLSFFEYVAIRKAKSLFCKLPQRRRLSGIEQILSHQFATWEIHRECILANVPPAWVHHLRLPGRGHSQQGTAILESSQ